MKLSAIVMCGLLVGALTGLAQNEENQAGALIHQGNLAGAIAALDTAITRAPSARLYAARADAYLRKGRMAQRDAMVAFDQAIADATEAVSRDASQAGAVMTRALAHQAKGEHTAAVADFTAVLASNPAAADALVGRSLSYKAIGNTNAAQKDQQAVGEINTRKGAELQQQLGGN